MQLINILKRKNVKVIEIPKWGTYLRKLWEDNFVNHLDDFEKKDIFLHDYGYLWHVFSYEKRECLKGNEAEQAFNAEQKYAYYIFYQHSDDALILEEVTEFNTKDLLHETDIYITDREFNWTYVRTHETGWCGPYFCRRNTKL